MTRSGGASTFGTIFKILPDGTGYSIFHPFAGKTSDGKYPEGGLTLVDGTLYGMTTYGGKNDCGTIFKISPDYQVYHDFDNDKEGMMPTGSLTLSSDGKYLYGTALTGGILGKGTIFKISTEKDDLVVIHNFKGDNYGMNPQGRLTLSSDGQYLYGITTYGGKNGCGTIFKIPTYATSETDIIIIHSFGDGAYPKDSPILSTDNGTLYGMTYTGGSKDKGTIFKITPTEGAEIEVIHSFTGSTTDGANPYYGSLILDGTTLYGTTRKGGVYDFGTIFSAQIPPTPTPSPSPSPAPPMFLPVRFQSVNTTQV